MPNVNDRLSKRATDSGRPELAHQSRGRVLSDAEAAFAAALSGAFAAGAKDFDAVVQTLRANDVKAPVSGRTDWSLDLLEAELTALNADLDATYQESGYGA